MNRSWIIVGLASALFIAAFLSLYASTSPDGLERVAEEKGFLEKSEVRPAAASPLPDYIWPGIKDKRLAASLAGATGTVAVFITGYALAFFIKRKA
jgi:cobalt/nickel transport protein